MTDNSKATADTSSAQAAVNASAPGAPELQPTLIFRYRQHLLLGFFVNFVWLVVVASGWFEWALLPADLRPLLGAFLPAAAAGLILRRTGFFRGQRPVFRGLLLFLLGFGLLVCAFALLFAFAVFAFAVGAGGPE